MLLMITFLFKFLVGWTLGNGYLELRGEGIRFSYCQGTLHASYFYWVWGILSEAGYCSNVEPFSSLTAPNKVYTALSLRIFSTSTLLWFYEAFYCERVKVIPSDKFLYQYFTTCSLAVLIADDGGRSGNGLKLYTYCFTKEEVERFVSFLKSKFNLDSTLCVQREGANGSRIIGYGVYICVNSMPSMLKFSLTLCPVIELLY